MQINQVQSALLSYSDDAEEQIKRAFAGREPADRYDFKLLNEVMSGVPGIKCKSWTDAQHQAFEKYARCLMDYFEMKNMSRHTDVGKMAQNLAEFERVMCRVADS